MIDEVIKMKQNKNIVSIFCDETDSTTFLEGYIYAVGVQKFLIKHITPHGLADGYILKELDSIVHLETGGKYERKIEKLNSPIVEQLRSLVEQSNKQVNVLQEENEIRKQQVAKLEESEERARKEARSAKILSIISFCVSTAIAIASLIVAIVK